MTQEEDTRHYRKKKRSILYPKDLHKRVQIFQKQEGDVVPSQLTAVFGHVNILVQRTVVASCSVTTSRLHRKLDNRTLPPRLAQRQTSEQGAVLTPVRETKSRAIHVTK